MSVGVPRRPHPVAALALTASAALCAPAAAQPAKAASTLYSCVDEHGAAHTSDRPIPECERRTVRELRGDGLLRREIPPPPTPEQLRARQAQAERQAELERERRQAEARDRALLATYPSLEALEAARRRQLAGIEGEIVRTQRRMVEMHAALKAARRQLADAERKPEAGGLRLRVTEIANAILVEDDSLKERAAEQARLEARFDADTQRLRDLLAARGLSPGAAAPAALSPRASAAAVR